MRNYTEKANKYRLPEERTNALRAFCHSALGDDLELIRDVAFDTVQDALANWIVMYVTDERMTWVRMEVRGVPCSRQTFRIYTLRFYWLLDKYVTEGGLAKDPLPPDDDGGGRTWQQRK